MRPRATWGSASGMLLAGLALLATSGCLPGRAGGGAGPGPIGTLRTDGPAVSLNGTSARDGVPVYSGDRVATGPASSARLELSGGAFVQLDENTDPEFLLLREGLCLLIQILSGQIFVNSANTCIQIEDPNTAGVLNSEVNWEVRGSQSVVTVLRGQVRLVRPARLRIEAAQQAVTFRGQVAAPRPIPPDEAARVTSWLQRYFRGVPGPAPGAPRPVSAVVPPVRGLSEDQAADRLARARLRVGQVTMRASGTAQPGTVIDQRPAAGEQVEPGTRVDLLVEAPGVRVPSVIGADEAAARAALEGAGLRPGPVEHRCFGRGRVGTVIDQRPRPGDVVSPGTPVSLVVRTLC